MSERPYIPLEQFTRPRDHSSRVVPLWVNGAPPFQLTLSTDVLTFGDRLVDTPSEPIMLEIVNTGFQPIHLISVTVEGVFTVPLIEPHVIEGGGGVTWVPVVFHPPVFGPHHGKLTIVTKEGIHKEVILIGSGIWDYINKVDQAIGSLWEFIKRVTLPALKSSGPIIDLGNTGVEFKEELEVGDESGVITYTINNIGNAPLIIDNIVVTGDFEIIP